MKLRTHYLFSAGLLALANSLFDHSFYSSLFIAGLVSVIGNSLIDKLGHEMVSFRGEYIPRRTPLTHTVPRSVLWGLISVLPIAALAYYVYPYYFAKVLAMLVLDGILVGPSHMLLDALTEKGIYVKRNGRWQRFALAHFRYNDPAANSLAGFAGVVMLFLAHMVLMP